MEYQQTVRTLRRGLSLPVLARVHHRVSFRSVFGGNLLLRSL
jgi:hypothetical protein